MAQMAVGLTQDMLDETPPGDGHRLNILSTAYTHIGIAVYRDGSGTVWLTEDFSGLPAAPCSPAAPTPGSSRTPQVHPPPATATYQVPAPLPP